MIYRHYGGGLYYMIGYATRMSENLPNTSIEQVDVALYEPTLEEIPVYIVHDKKVGSTYYAYSSNKISGVMCFYKGLEGIHWLRSREVFFENVDLHDPDNSDHYQAPRFEKVSGEYLFDTISELMGEKNEA